MKYLILLLALLLVLFLFPVRWSIAEAPKAPIAPEKPSISQLITLYADKYHVPEKVLKSVIYCESRYDKNAIGDFGYSYGLVQIFLPAHPNISKSDALDPDFAIRYLAKNISEGHGRMWSCYRQLFTFN